MEHSSCIHCFKSQYICVIFLDRKCRANAFFLLKNSITSLLKRLALFIVLLYFCKHSNYCFQMYGILLRMATILIQGASDHSSEVLIFCFKHFLRNSFLLFIVFHMQIKRTTIKNINSKLFLQLIISEKNNVAYISINNERRCVLVTYEQRVLFEVALGIPNVTCKSRGRDIAVTVTVNLQSVFCAANHEPKISCLR